MEQRLEFPQRVYMCEVIAIWCRLHIQKQKIFENSMKTPNPHIKMLTLARACSETLLSTFVTCCNPRRITVKWVGGYSESTRSTVRNNQSMYTFRKGHHPNAWNAVLQIVLHRLFISLRLWVNQLQLILECSVFSVRCCLPRNYMGDKYYFFCKYIASILFLGKLYAYACRGVAISNYAHKINMHIVSDRPGDSISRIHGWHALQDPPLQCSVAILI